jgi:hypothetical protein
LFAYSQGATAGNRGGRFVFQTKADGGTFNDRWSIENTGNFFAAQDSTYTIGQSLANRPLAIYTPDIRLERAGAASALIRSHPVAAQMELGTLSNHAVSVITNSTARWVFDGTGALFAAADNTYDIGASGANRPRNVYVAGAVANRIKAGTPVDADVTNPTDGMLIVDTTASKIWTRIGGVWKGVIVA